VIAAGDPEASAKAIAAARRELDGAMAAGGRTLTTVSKAFERLERAAATAGLQRIGREKGRRWLVTGVYFLPGRDRIRPDQSRAALADIAMLLEICPRIVIEIAALPGDDVDRAHAVKTAAARAFELESYLLQTGVPDIRIRRIPGPSAPTPEAADPEPLLAHRRAWGTAPPSGVEDGRIVLTVVRPCP